jgi:hypothetical protein
LWSSIWFGEGEKCYSEMYCLVEVLLLEVLSLEVLLLEVLLLEVLLLEVLLLEELCSYRIVQSKCVCTISLISGNLF